MSKNDPHILGKESIGKLLLQYSIPAIIGMTITSIYNIIDSIFIGHGVGYNGDCRTSHQLSADESGGGFLYIGIGGRFYAGVYPSGAKGHEGGYGNLVTHVDALYH